MAGTALPEENRFRCYVETDPAGNNPLPPTLRLNSAHKTAAFKRTAPGFTPGGFSFPITSFPLLPRQARRPRAIADNVWLSEIRYVIGFTPEPGEQITVFKLAGNRACKSDKRMVFLSPPLLIKRSPRTRSFWHAVAFNRPQARAYSYIFKINFCLRLIPPRASLIQIGKKRFRFVQVVNRVGDHIPHPGEKRPS